MKKISLFLVIITTSAVVHAFAPQLNTHFKNTNTKTPMMQQSSRDFMVSSTSSAITTEVEAYNSMTQQHGSMKQEFNNALNRFKKSQDYGESALQKVMDLLELELVIVNHLLMGHTGHIVEEAIMCRNHALAHSTPSIAFMYDKVFDLVSYDEYTNRQLYHRAGDRRGKELTRVLNWHDKKSFLYAMHDKLQHYSSLMRAIQCDFAVGSSTARDMVAVDVEGASMSFCPVIK